MDLLDALQALASRVSKQVDRLETEEATKNALVMPFINALGYNVFDPAEVTPELTADVGTKKGEKVDYAVLKDGEVVMLFECKSARTNLDKVHASQLFRYFTVTQARIGVLTNGIVYRFYSDLESPNRMDDKPFLELDLFNLSEAVILEVKKLTKPYFDQDAIIEAAGELKYTREIKRILGKQMTEPDEEFVALLTKQVYSGRVTQSVREQFAEVVKRALKQLVNEQISDRLKSALEQDDEPELASDRGEMGADEEQEVEPTEEEREGFHIVRAILSDVVDPKRVVMRDVKSYCGVLLDDNNRQPLARLWFNAESQKYIGLFDNHEKEEDRVPLESVHDIYRVKDRLLATPSFYED